MADKKIVIERETFIGKDKKSYFSYFIKGKIRDKDVKVALVPPDRGGYAVLDIVFGDEMQAELTLKPYEITDEKTGNVIKGNTYYAQTVDANGEEFECQVKAYRNSDKMLLNMLLKRDA